MSRAPHAPLPVRARTLAGSDSRVAPALPGAIVALGAIAAMSSACTVAEPARPTSPRDTQATPDATADSQGDSGPELINGHLACEVGAPEGCPDGQFCETTAHVCVDCVGFTQRCGERGRETCAAPDATGIGALTGGYFVRDPCDPGTACVQAGVLARCDPEVCIAGETRCISGAKISRCNASGTVLSEEACAAGKACYSGACEPIRHNVLLIFDTSGSMNDYVDQRAAAACGRLTKGVMQSATAAPDAVSAATTAGGLVADLRHNLTLPTDGTGRGGFVQIHVSNPGRYELFFTEALAVTVTSSAGAAIAATPAAAPATCSIAQTRVAMDLATGDYTLELRATAAVDEVAMVLIGALVGGFATSPNTCEQDGSPCLGAFPACDDPANPLAIFSVAKNVFSEVVATAVGRFSQFALQRFPQREAGSNPASCEQGWYTVLPDYRMTGDDDARAAGAWFGTNLSQTVVVPFPVRNTLENDAALLGWLDFEESLAPSSTGCATSSDCGTGRCGTVDGAKRCFYHRDEELRAVGTTPLGKSLFYAGEYVRTRVRIDGKACANDGQCGSAGYVCREEKCVDPYRHCKEDFIILFTDGEESEFQEETSFFNPVVQAQRLAFGLDCQADGDCRGGATCQDHICLGKDQVPSDVPRVTGDGFGALAAPDGTPISIRTTVIALDTRTPTNGRVAKAGGGAQVDVTAGDPETFKQLLFQAMTPNFKCQPEDL